MKKILTLLVIMLPSFLAFAQISNEEAQLFGFRNQEERSCDLGPINTVTQHVFYIKNTSPLKMTLVSIKANEGVVATLNNNVIYPNSRGELKVIVDPDKIKVKGDFNFNITVTFKQNSAIGTTTKEMVYTVKGSL